MARLYGRAPGGGRVNDYVPDVRFERASVISSIRLKGETVPLMFKGALNGELFKQYVAECLAPTVKEGDIVIIDNLSSHKTAGALDPIFKQGATVLFLPPYSPGFNPIELSWSKMKSVLKRLKSRTYEELITAMQIALDSFTAKDIANWFAHDGYCIV